MTQPRSRRAYAWLSCREKACCRRGADITDADIARIAAGLGVEASHLVTPEDAGDEDPAAIALGPGPRVKLRLTTTARGCVFLVRTRSGAGRCGLGDLAPAACRIFPADPARPDPGVRPEPGCECRSWTDTDLDGDELATPVRAAHDELIGWHDRIARWNADNAGADGLDLADFLRHLRDRGTAR